ncbi:hypothetical protein ACFWA5_19310 [Streptomyces mirabilis]
MSGDSALGERLLGLGALPAEATVALYGRPAFPPRRPGFAMRTTLTGLRS